MENSIKRVFLCSRSGVLFKFRGHLPKSVTSALKMPMVFSALLTKQIPIRITFRRRNHSIYIQLFLMSGQKVTSRLLPEVALLCHYNLEVTLLWHFNLEVTLMLPIFGFIFTNLVSPIPGVSIKFTLHFITGQLM